MPLQTVVPLILVLDFSASLLMSRNARADVKWQEIIPLFPTSLIGIVFGVTLLVSLPREPLLTERTSTARYSIWPAIPAEYSW